ncbi:hypothetical protein BEP19_01565 [Ammoniphilus oxalaticus]|uniref:Uncharacterized protein n=2 Tax=Ammoniphilus oxalaticus TaxID=66863 RepID=A0A419SP46_9BACL|nr:hypothetical protein BEP19_01565 [Ammoniphilus oxalaticus]
MNYTFDDLTRDLMIGHELHFRYNGKNYYISQSQGGWVLTRFDQQYELFESQAALLQGGKIDGKSLREIWDEVEVTDLF